LLSECSPFAVIMLGAVLQVKFVGIATLGVEGRKQEAA
jgi:hypothetical protein